MRLIGRIALGVLLALAAVVTIGWVSRSPAAPTYHPPALALEGRLRTWEEHDEIVKTHGHPYVLKAGSLVFFGARHTSDRDDPQLAAIEKAWQEQKPTVALYEGRRRSYFVGPMFAIGDVTESRLVHQLARRDKVRMLSLEPAYEDEVRELLRKWTAQQVALFFFTRVYWSEAGGKADEGLATDLLAKRTDVEGLRGSLSNLADVDRVWKRDFKGDWRTLAQEPEGSYLGKIGDDSRQIRGEHMARTLIDLTRKGERVFAVVGSGHVIRTEPIIRATLER